jgi:hypothetical protein
VKVSWPQVLAWRLRRQFLDPVGADSVETVVRRLGAVQAQFAASAELAVRLRRADPTPGEVDAALLDGRIIKAWIVRGAMHLLTPEDGGAYMALRAATRQWELPSWQSFYGLAPGDWEPFRQAVREALTDGPMTPAELGAAVTARPAFQHLEFAFAEHWHTLLKPLFWQGVICFGPMRGDRPTFQRVEDNPRWAGVPELGEAGRRVVETYLRAYGPATVTHLRYWQNTGERNVRSWLDALGERLASVDVDGDPHHVLAEDIDELAATRPSKAVRLLPGYDQWVMGPSTDDPHIVPPARRALISRGAPFVIVGGVVSGTWAFRKDEVAIAWFAEAGRRPNQALGDEVERLATLTGRSLRMTVHDT